jgi:hypothetical protein
MKLELCWESQSTPIFGSLAGCISGCDSCIYCVERIARGRGPSFVIEDGWLVAQTIHYTVESV